MEGFRDSSGKRHRAIKYIADFRYRDSVGGLVIEDVKGYDKKRKKPYTTDVFKIKEKLFRNRYPDLDFRIVVSGKWREK